MTNDEIRGHSEKRVPNRAQLHELLQFEFGRTFPIHSFVIRICRVSLSFAILPFLLGSVASGQTLKLPPRPANAPGASALLPQIAALDLIQREERLVSEILGGNVPDFLRTLCPVHITNIVSGTTNELTIFVTPDYLVAGSDNDYFLAPLSPPAAQRIADAANCSLPTPKIVDLIYRQSKIQLAPSPIAPSAAMTTMRVFSNHNFIVWQQRQAVLATHPLGQLVAGHKKDVVISARLPDSPGKVAIYGWHQTGGSPIQPLYLGHTSSWVDYSQCIRLVQQAAILNGKTTTIAHVLGDPGLATLISEEGPMHLIRYPTHWPAATLARTNESVRVIDFSGFHDSGSFQEEIASFSIEPEVKVRINRQRAREGNAIAKTNQLLIFYALPNGNTIAQTAGHRIKPGEDWHFDIQHIAAQTRFLRQLQPQRDILVAYFESGEKSWPAWRKAHDDALLRLLLSEVTKLCATDHPDLALISHSGGGSLIFGYLNAVEKIPGEITRIAFLDSDYAYDPGSRHDQKLADWLRASDRHYLCVLAYDDGNALLNGKPFVSASGGTWGRSHAMETDLAKIFHFTNSTNSGLENFSALNGRIQFLLKQNPERKILHTIQVERNGFIHSVLSGTTLGNNGYEYFGDRAYSELIGTE